MGGIDFLPQHERIHSVIGNISIGSWNVEGLTDIKIEEIMIYMRQLHIDICCLQETRKPKSDIFLRNGYKVVLSGSGVAEREWAGVGFILSPRAQKSIVGFCQLNNRMASLRLKAVGGVFAVFSVYSPHNLKDLVDRIEFYEQLMNCCGKPPLMVLSWCMEI